MSYENDIARIKEAPIHISAVREVLIDINNKISVLMEFRKKINLCGQISIEEYIHEKYHITNITDDDKKRYSDSYQQYTDLLLRQKNEHLSRVENTRLQLKEKLHSVRSQLRNEREVFDRILRKIDNLCRTVDQLDSHFDQAREQLTLEQLKIARDMLNNNDWAKERYY